MRAALVACAQWESNRATLLERRSHALGKGDISKRGRTIVLFDVLFDARFRRSTRPPCEEKMGEIGGSIVLYCFHFGPCHIDFP